MTRPIRHPDTPNGLGTLVVLAIGLQLMLSGAGLATHARADGLDRTGIRRLSDSVVQALREISERAVREGSGIEHAPDWADAPARVWYQPADAVVVRPRLSAWVLSVAPPAVG